jgi:AcrR family transcriptional regulator
MAKSTRTRSRARLGRPPKEFAGDVEGRILDAAEKVFLTRGFHSASIDEIAEAAPVSKPTIYAHFSGKEALFAAVVTRILRGLTDFAGYVAEGRTVHDRLTSLGTAIVERGIEDWVGVARVTIAEAQRLPKLSRDVHEASRDRAAKVISELLQEATPLLSRKPSAPFGSTRSKATTQIYMDLVLLPMLMRALMGDEPKAIRRDLPDFVRDRVRFFLSACEADWKQG